jgi:hypothetical protein
VGVRTLLLSLRALAVRPLPRLWIGLGVAMLTPPTSFASGSASPQDDSTLSCTGASDHR